jgi:hypothetical protein
MDKSNPETLIREVAIISHSKNVNFFRLDMPQKISFSQ